MYPHTNLHHLSSVLFLKDLFSLALFLLDCVCVCVSNWGGFCNAE